MRAALRIRPPRFVLSGWTRWAVPDVVMVDARRPIQAFLSASTASRGWSAFADHDEERTTPRRSYFSASPAIQRPPCRTGDGLCTGDPRRAGAVRRHRTKDPDTMSWKQLHHGSWQRPMSDLRGRCLSGQLVISKTAPCLCAFRTERCILHWRPSATTRVETTLRGPPRILSAGRAASAPWFLSPNAPPPQNCFSNRLM